MPRILVVLTLAAWASAASAAEPLHWSGFALLRGASRSEGVPLDENQGSAQVQVGIDWQPSAALRGQVHLLARDDGDHARRGRIGVVQAYLEQRVRDRWRFTEGAFFLPTSRENVDALWESPYTITSSALNSWLGEELRPIGVDAAYTWRRRLTVGATVFRGNDTFGALPVDRGWAFRDEWLLLGEHLPTGDEDYHTSVSAETDHRLGWSARGRWQNQYATLQLTHIDNRADAQQHGELVNWATRFDIAAAEVNLTDWTIAAESGWGETRVFEFPYPIRAGYLLVSRRFEKARVTLRADTFNGGHAVTAAFFWSPPGHLRTGVELIDANGDKRVAVELRYHFAGR
ncbi:MAG TPA: hypothetical protein VGR02_04585 [Thermoanaerobaculia bacterium]|jgi:hypothetical protein|nr:hypothetical protein [Thermoanaerobaculia bacterium]